MRVCRTDSVNKESNLMDKLMLQGCGSFEKALILNSYTVKHGSWISLTLFVVFKRINLVLNYTDPWMTTVV